MKKIKYFFSIFLILLSLISTNVAFALEDNQNNSNTEITDIEEKNNPHKNEELIDNDNSTMNNDDATDNNTSDISKQEEINANNIYEASPKNIDVYYTSHVQTYGWQDTVKNGELSGTEGKGKRMEAIKIRLTGSIADNYNIYYRVHVQSYGWLDWAKNGETAGTIGFGKRIEAVEIKIVNKSEVINQTTSYYQKTDFLSYSAHIQSYGWQNKVTSGVIGTEGKGKRLEGYNVNFEFADYPGQLQYKSYIEGTGWESSWKKNGETSGTIGKSKKIEQVKMQLTGDVANYYDVYYRAHVQGFGWLGWAKNGEVAGSDNIGLRIEAMEIKVIPKGTGETTGSSLATKGASISYSAHVRRIGDQAPVSEGQIAGTTGQSLRMEGLRVNIDSETTGSIMYKSYVEDIGWEQDYKKDGELSGTTGQSKPIQLFRMKLTGELANKYDIYYRVHTDHFGWLGWARNDEVTGADCYEIQAIEIRLYLKIDSNQKQLDRSRIHIETGFYKENGYTYYRDKNGNQANDWIRIMDTKYFFNSLGVMIGKNVKKVMDVSAWQGDIDWDTVYKYGDIDGVILRIAAGCEQEDAKLARNIAALKRLNIPYGIYIYSYAETYNEGSLYADFTIRVLEKYNMNPRIGIFLDLEANSITNYLTNAHYEQLTKGFMDKMSTTRFGSLCKIYTYKSLAEEKMYTPYLYNQITWIAHYNHFNRYVNENVVGWQYSSQEYVPGVPTLADMSVWFTNF